MKHNFREVIKEYEVKGIEGFKRFFYLTFLVQLVCGRINLSIFVSQKYTRVIIKYMVNYFNILLRAMSTSDNLFNNVIFIRFTDL